MHVGHRILPNVQELVDDRVKRCAVYCIGLDELDEPCHVVIIVKNNRTKKTPECQLLVEPSILVNFLGSPVPVKLAKPNAGVRIPKRFCKILAKFCCTR